MDTHLVLGGFVLGGALAGQVSLPSLLPVLAVLFSSFHRNIVESVTVSNY